MTTPDEHAKFAEGLLESDRREGGKVPLRQVVLLRAIVHAILSLRGTGAPPRRRNADPKPAQKRAAKKTTTKEKDA